MIHRHPGQVTAHLWRGFGSLSVFLAALLQSHGTLRFAMGDHHVEGAIPYTLVAAGKACRNVHKEVTYVSMSPQACAELVCADPLCGALFEDRSHKGGSCSCLAPGQVCIEEPDPDSNRYEITDAAACEAPQEDHDCFMIVFDEGDFTGLSASFPEGWVSSQDFEANGVADNSISSVFVSGSGCYAVVYGEPDYQGWSVTLTEGSYTIDDLLALAVVDDDISSLAIQWGSVEASSGDAPPPSPPPPPPPPVGHPPQGATEGQTDDALPSTTTTTSTTTVTTTTTATTTTTTTTYTAPSSSSSFGLSSLDKRLYNDLLQRHQSKIDYPRKNRPAAAATIFPDLSSVKNKELMSSSSDADALRDAQSNAAAAAARAKAAAATTAAATAAYQGDSRDSRDGAGDGRDDGEGPGSSSSSSSSSSRHDSLTEVPAPPPPPPPPPPPRIKGNEADGGSVLGTLWNRFTGSSGTEEPNSAAAQATTVTATTTSTLTFTSADDPSGNPPTKPPPAGMKTSPQSSQRKPSPKPKVVIPTAVDRPTWAAKVRPERWLQIPAWARKHLTNEWCEPTQQAKCSDEERAYLEKSLRDFCGGPCQRSHRHALEDEAKRVGAKRGDVKKVAVPWVEKRVAILWSLAVLAPEKSEL